MCSSIYVYYIWCVYVQDNYKNIAQTLSGGNEHENN